MLDGTVVKPRLDREATAISVLVALGVQWDGQKVHMAGESTAAWRQFLEKLDARGLPQPTLVSIDGAPGLEAAVAPSGEKARPSNAVPFTSTATCWPMRPSGYRRS